MAYARVAPSDSPASTSPASSPATAPQQEIGYVSTRSYGQMLLDDAEQTPELMWPLSVFVYDQMRRTDAQVQSVLQAITKPLLATSWRIDPNGARDEVTRFVADDLRLPVVGEEPRQLERLRDRFSWLEHLRLALLMLPYGHMYFEQVYRVDEDGQRAHLRKLSPRMPRTLRCIEVAEDGGLISISQWWSKQDQVPQPIPVDRLVAYINEREGGNWLGFSILRPAYKNWLIKDRLLRVWAQTIERNGMGIPLYKGQEDASADDLAKGKLMATKWRSGEAAGSAVPFGADLVLRGVEGTLPDADPAVRYHDEQIARAVLAHFLTLGTETGSWALGSSWQDFFVLSLQTLAQQLAENASAHIVEDLVDVNWGPDEPAPRLVFDEIGSRQPATADAIASLTTSGVVRADDKLEQATRQRYGLPPADPDTAREAPQGAPSPAGGTDGNGTASDTGMYSVAAAAHVDEYPEDHDDATADLEAALALFESGAEELVAAKYNPKELRVDHGEGGGRWTASPVTSAILKALKEAESGDGKGDPFAAITDREPLRRVAVKRGIKLKRGASRDEIVAALKDDVRSKSGGAKAPSTPEADRVARIQAARPLAHLARDIDSASTLSEPDRSQVIGEHIDGAEQAGELTPEQAGKLRTTLASEGGASKVKAAVNRLNKSNGVTPIGNADKTTTFDPALHRPLHPVADPAEVRQVEVENRIRAAYRELAPGQRSHVYLADLRERSGVAPADFDAALVRMSTEGGQLSTVHLAPQEDRRRLNARLREAAIRHGGDEMHMVSFEDPSPRPLPSGGETSIAPGTRVRVVQQGHALDGEAVEKAVVAPVGRPAKKAATVQTDTGTRITPEEAGRIMHGDKGYEQKVAKKAAPRTTAAKKMTAAQAAKLTPAELQQAVTDGRVTPRVATQAGNLMEQALRDRHAHIAGKRKVAEVAAEVHELVDNESSPAVLTARLKAAQTRHGVDTTKLQALVDNPDALLAEADRMAAEAGLTRVGPPARQSVPFDRQAHKPIGGGIAEGSPVEVVRPGYVWTDADGNQVRVADTLVEQATPATPSLTPAPKAAKATARQAASRLASAGTREEAEAALQGLTKPQLLEVARERNMTSIVPSLSRDEMAYRIVELAGAGRYDSVGSFLAGQTFPTFSVPSPRPETIGKATPATPSLTPVKGAPDSTTLPPGVRLEPAPTIFGNVEKAYAVHVGDTDVGRVYVQKDGKVVPMPGGGSGRGTRMPDTPPGITVEQAAKALVDWHEADSQIAPADRARAHVEALVPSLADGTGGSRVLEGSRWSVVGALHNSAELAPATMLRLDGFEYAPADARQGGMFGWDYGTAAQYDQFSNSILMSPHWRTDFGRMRNAGIDGHQSGWYTPTPDPGLPGHTVAHEYGHHVVKTMDVNGLDEQQAGELYSALERALELPAGSIYPPGSDPDKEIINERLAPHSGVIRGRISGYAAQPSSDHGHSQLDELLAEVWQEYSMMGAKSRPHITAIGEIMARLAEQEATRQS